MHPGWREMARVDPLGEARYLGTAEDNVHLVLECRKVGHCNWEGVWRIHGSEWTVTVVGRLPQKLSEEDADFALQLSPDEVLEAMTQP